MLRFYRGTDLDALVALDERCFERVFRFDRSSMRRFAEGRHAHTVVSEAADGSLDGFLIVELAGRSRSRHGYLVTLDVAPEMRRSGLGRRLLQSGESWVAAHGGSYMKLHVWVGNAGAIRFYERLLYTYEGTVPEFYGAEGMDALVYGKPLPAATSE